MVTAADLAFKKRSKAKGRQRRWYYILHFSFILTGWKGLSGVSMSPFLTNCVFGAEQGLSVCVISLRERSLKSSLLKTLVISFLGQAIYVQPVDVDIEGCRAAGQPGGSQGHFLRSAPYRARLWQEPRPSVNI